MRGFEESGDDAGAEGDRNHSGAVASAQLAGDAREVALDRQRREAHLLADVPVRPPISDMPDDFDLPRGQAANDAPAVPVPLSRLSEPPRLKRLLRSKDEAIDAGLHSRDHHPQIAHWRDADPAPPSV